MDNKKDKYLCIKNMRLPIVQSYSIFSRTNLSLNLTKIKLKKG